MVRELATAASSIGTSVAARTEHTRTYVNRMAGQLGFSKQALSNLAKDPSSRVEGLKSRFRFGWNIESPNIKP